MAGNVTALGGKGGSGGAIKLIADQATGTGLLNAGTTGRVRVEANSMSAGVSPTPATIAVPPGTTPTIFQSSTSPTVRIVSVDGLSSANPNDPHAELITGADTAIYKNTAVTIMLETRNFVTAGAVVALRIGNKFGGASSVNATFVDGTSAFSTWRVITTLQARATGP